MSIMMAKQEGKLSFVDTAKTEKRFDKKAYQNFIASLKYTDFIYTPYDGEPAPLSIMLDTINNPVSNEQFNTTYYDNWSYVRINGHNGSSAIRVYMQDLQKVIDALVKIKEGFEAVREAGVRDFPKLAGYEEWLATQGNDKNCVCEAIPCN